MKITSQRIVSVLILIFLVQILSGCATTPATLADFAPAPGQVVSAPGTPVPGSNQVQDPAYSKAQATIDAARNQLMDVSRRSTEVALNMAQAANANVQSTLDYNRRQKAELDYQATIISLNMMQAAATQKALSQQTKAVEDAAAAARRNADSATQMAYLINVTQTARAQAAIDAASANSLTATAFAYSMDVNQTAQAQAILNAQATQAAQEYAALLAYPLTATPLAQTQAALLMQQYAREQNSFVDQIVAPLIPILASVVLVLFILVVIKGYRRYVSQPQPGRLLIGQGYVPPSPLIMIEGVIAEAAPEAAAEPPLAIPLELTLVNPPELPEMPEPPVVNAVHVEIMDATEPPVAHWIADVERQLGTEGRI